MNQYVPAVSGYSDRCGGGEKSKLPRFRTLLLVSNLNLSATEESRFQTLQYEVCCVVFFAPQQCFLSSRGFLLDGCSLLSLTEEDGVRNIRDGCRIAMKRKVTLVPHCLSQNQLASNQSKDDGKVTLVLLTLSQNPLVSLSAKSPGIRPESATSSSPTYKS